MLHALQTLAEHAHVRQQYLICRHLLHRYGLLHHFRQLVLRAMGEELASNVNHALLQLQLRQHPSKASFEYFPGSCMYLSKASRALSAFAASSQAEISSRSGLLLKIEVQFAEISSPNSG